MIKSTKKAFTLVELIVVITILAILGTIAFISLQGYSAEARDSKRLTNINDLTRKINIEIARSTSPSELIVIDADKMNGVTPRVKADFTGLVDVTEASQGIVNFAAIKENRENFQDPSAKVGTGTNRKAQDYPFSYAIGGKGEEAYSFIQMATVVEAKNIARVVGNYYKVGSATAESLIMTGTYYVVDGKGLSNENDTPRTALPYSF